MTLKQQKVSLFDDTHNMLTTWSFIHTTNNSMAAVLCCCQILLV